MRSHFHFLARRRIDQLFTVGLPIFRYRALLQELSECGACAQRFRRHQVLESIVCGGRADAPSAFVFERIEHAILDAIASPSRVGESELRPTEPPHGKAPRPAQKRRLRVLAWAIGPLLGAASVVLLLLRPWSADAEHIALQAGSRLEDVQTVARGGSPKASAVGIRLFRVATGQSLRRAVREADGLTMDDVITFTYTNISQDLRYAMIIGLQGTTTIRWYYPTYGGKTSIPIRGGVVDEPLGDGIRLRVHHTPGRLRIAAIFSSEPIRTDVVARAVRASRSTGTGEPEDLSALALPGANVVQHSIVTNVASSP